jgi:hypothetical protein
MPRRLQPHPLARRPGLLPLFMGLAIFVASPDAWGQSNIPQWSPHRPVPAPLEAPAAGTPPLAAAPLPAPSLQAPPPQAPLAWHRPASGPQWVLVRNRNTSTGLPPYALADAQGKLVRYVEPSPGIPIESYLGQTVEVRHDTGKILLSSQLVVVGTPSVGTSAIPLAEQRVAAEPVTQTLAGSKPPLDQAELMAQQLLGEHEEVHDRGPMQSLFEWAGGKRLGRFISVGEPRDESNFETPAQDVASNRAVRHTTASPQWMPPQRW